MTRTTLRTARKQRGRPFRKGQSGNPGGRPKKTPEMVEIEDLARRYSVDAIKQLAAWMRSDNPKASVSACQAILDRAWGKPTQEVKHKGRVTHDIGSLTDAELAAIVAGAIGGGRNSAETEDPDRLH